MNSPFKKEISIFSSQDLVNEHLGLAVQIAVDFLVNEGLIDFATALKRVEKYDLNKIVRTRLSLQSNLRFTV